MVFSTSWILLVAVAAKAADSGAGNFTTSWIDIVSQDARHHFTVELALTPEQREQGLQHRESLPPDHGMLFDFGAEQSVYFWMKNTPIPLDMLFVAGDGRIVGFARRTTPYSHNTIPSPQPVRYVLEIGGGIARHLGLQVGDRLTGPGLGQGGG